MSAAGMRTLSMTMAITEGVESAIGDINLSGRNKRRWTHIERNREQADADLLVDYLQDCSTYRDNSVHPAPRPILFSIGGSGTHFLNLPTSWRTPDGGYI
jgi:hypothetical protein